jgi:hypothetical protein
MLSLGSRYIQKGVAPDFQRLSVEAARRTGDPKARVFAQRRAHGGRPLVDAVEHHAVPAFPNDPQEQEDGRMSERACRNRDGPQQVRQPLRRRGRAVGCF